MAQDAIVTIKLSVTRTNLVLSVLGEAKATEESEARNTAELNAERRRKHATRAAELAEIIDIIGGK